MDQTIRRIEKEMKGLEKADKKRDHLVEAGKEAMAHKKSPHKKEMAMKHKEHEPKKEAHKKEEHKKEHKHKK